jgi:spore germination protein YaaH
MPMLSNSYNSKFNGAALHRIFNDPKKMDRLIHDVVRLLHKYNFAGINVDFEELEEDSDEVLINFERKLYDTLHKNGFLLHRTFLRLTRIIIIPNSTNTTTIFF